MIKRVHERHGMRRKLGHIRLHNWRTLFISNIPLHASSRLFNTFIPSQ